MRIFLTAYLLTFAVQAFALEVPANMNIRWTLPTQTECLEPAPAVCVHLPLTDELALTAIELYVSDVAISDNAALTPTSTLGGDAKTVKYNAVAPAGSTLYVRLKARNVFNVSEYSPQISAVVNVPNVAPGAPTNVTVEITIGVAPAP